MIWDYRLFPCRNADGKWERTNLRGVFGINAIWFIPTSGTNVGEAYMFGYSQMECETTRPFFTADEQTLFLSIQHPGEVNGIRKDGDSEDRMIYLQTPQGEEFMQTTASQLAQTGSAKNPMTCQSLLLSPFVE